EFIFTHQISNLLKLPISTAESQRRARRQNYFPLSLQSEKPFEKDTAV
ncbi:MAG: hypothetical protein AVDCRST_MAG74-3045, partial [uncultured Pyrinomonadaceae bacterium]